MLPFLCYLLIGAIAGIFAGLLGIGGGLIVVPALTLLLPWAGIPAQYVVHISVATSLATIVVTSSVSTFNHHKHGAVRWGLVKRMAPFLIVGVMMGAVLATYIPGKLLAKFIAVLILILAIRMFMQNHATRTSNTTVAVREPRWRFVIFNTFFGVLSATFGIGGGAFLVPYLQGRLQTTMAQAVATGSAAAVILGFISIIIYIILGWHLSGLPPHTIGYIYWPAWLGIVISSVFFVGFGVKLAHKLSDNKLRYVFACFLLVVAIKMAL